MNDYVFVPELFEVVRDSYRRDTSRLYKAVTGEAPVEVASPRLSARFAAAWRAFFANDVAMPARGGQGA